VDTTPKKSFCKWTCTRKFFITWYFKPYQLYLSVVDRVEKV